MKMHTRFGRRFCKLNHHSHTNCSDGYTAPLQTLLLAVKHDVVLGITDHNTVAALRALQELSRSDPIIAHQIKRHILPGCEVQTAEGAELLIYADTCDELITFFDAEIAPHLDATDPLYAPIQLAMPDLIATCKTNGVRMVIPHFMLRRYGIGRLPREQLELIKQALRSATNLVAVEHNPFLTRWQNVQASFLARRLRAPILAGADSHDSWHHKSFTRVRRQSDQFSAADVFGAVWQRFPRSHHRHLEMMSWMRAFIHGGQIAWQIGLPGLYRFLKQEMRWWLGVNSAPPS